MGECKYYIPPGELKKVPEFRAGMPEYETTEPRCGYPDSPWGIRCMGHGPLECENNTDKCQIDGIDKNSLKP